MTMREAAGFFCCRSSHYSDSQVTEGFRRVYERSWEPEGWTLDDDFELKQALEDHEEMWWRLNDLRAGYWRMPRDSSSIKDKPFRAYDPALLACGEALYLALILQQSDGDTKWINGCIAELKHQLIRYQAASLEVLMGRQAVFTSGRTQGALSAIHGHLRKLYQKLYYQLGKPLKFNSFWAAIDAECLKST